jgi:hypothetical protein
MDSAGRQEVAILLCCASNFREIRLCELKADTAHCPGLISHEPPCGGARLMGIMRKSGAVR